MSTHIREKDEPEGDEGPAQGVHAAHAARTALSHNDSSPGFHFLRASLKESDDGSSGDAVRKRLASLAEPPANGGHFQGSPARHFRETDSTRPKHFRVEHTKPDRAKLRPDPPLTRTSPLETTVPPIVLPGASQTLRTATDDQPSSSPIETIDQSPSPSTDSVNPRSLFQSSALREGWGARQILALPDGAHFAPRLGRLRVGRITNRVGIAVIASAVVLLGISIAFANHDEPSAPPSSSNCPVRSKAALTTDVDGDGCSDAIAFRPGEISVNGETYSVGEAGDRQLIGRWHDNSLRTLAVFRPDTGEVYVFDRWPSAGTELSPTLAGSVPGAAGATVSPQPDGTDHIVLTRPDGVTVEVDPETKTP